MELNKESFITRIGDRETTLHLLKNKKGMEVAVTNYGARFVTIICPDKEGRPTDVVVGFDSIAGYLNSTETYYSALVGRYANRIAEGKFQLDGRKYQLAINNAPNHLHGGPQGFHKQVWEIKKGSDNTIELYYFSKDGEENYPGNLEVTVIYSLTDDNELVIAYKATTDAPTIINLTSHPFFNLNGQGSGTIEKHVLQIEADHYNPVFENLIPRGIEKVANTPFDFRKAKTIGQDIQDQNLQLIFGAGYDHNYILNGQGFRKVARVQGDRSGIVMEVLTNQPGMQFYSGNYMKGENQIKNGLKDYRREAFCLETQHFPDSPNQPEFPSTVLRPGEKFESKTVYKFYAEGFDSI